MLSAIGGMDRPFWDEILMRLHNSVDDIFADVITSPPIHPAIRPGAPSRTRELRASVGPEVRRRRERSASSWVKWCRCQKGCNTQGGKWQISLGEVKKVVQISLKKTRGGS